METIKTIKKSFAYFRTNYKDLNFLKEEGYWVVKIETLQGVAIEVPTNIIVNEQFASIYYYTKNYLINGKVHHFLLLVSDNPKLYEDFSFICGSFLEKALDTYSTEEIQTDPISWWHAMKELMGNANVEKTTYSIIAEMMSYYYLKKKSEKVNWTGYLGNTIDLENEKHSFEVKSTLSRYTSTITINSQYQLKADYLMFFRFEQSEQGISIQDMVDRLVSIGVEEAELERVLKKMKYPKGSHVRSIAYRLLEAKIFKVDESFPKITLESFKDNKVPDHISGITYTLNLEGLKSKALTTDAFK